MLSFAEEAADMVGKQGIGCGSLNCESLDISGCKSGGLDIVAKHSVTSSPSVLRMGTMCQGSFPVK